MLEESTGSAYQQQKPTKPTPEEVIPKYLDGDMKKNALDIVTYLRANKMTPGWASGNSWKANYKGKGICYVKLFFNGHGENATDCGGLNKYSWAVALRPINKHKFEEHVMNEELMNIFCDKVWSCHCCGRIPPNNCGQRRDVFYFGKEIKGVCGNNFPTWFCDPGEEEINIIKRLIEFEQSQR